MCYQLSEVYSFCKCPYYIHAIDRCAGYGKPNHGVISRSITVGYACPEHSGAAPGRTPQEESDELFSDVDYVFSNTCKASSGISLLSEAGEGPAERLFRDLLLEPQMQHLLPQLVRISKAPQVAKRNINRFLKRFGKDLRAHSEIVAEFQVAEYVRRSRKNITRRIVKCHSVELRRAGTLDSKTDPSHGRAAHMWFLGHNPADEDEAKAPPDTQPTELVYDTLVGFLFHGPPFEAFRESMKDFIEKSGAPAAHPFHAELAAGRNILSAFENRYRRPEPGRKRLWWTCICGQEVYDDYEELRSGALEDLQGFLSSYRRSTPLADPAPTEEQLKAMKAISLCALLFLPITFAASMVSLEIPPWGDTTPRDDESRSMWPVVLSVIVGWSSMLMLSIFVVLKFVQIAQKHAQQRSRQQASGHGGPPDEEVGNSRRSGESSLRHRGILGRFRSSSSRDSEDPDISECPTRNALPGDEQRHRFLLLCIPFMRWGLKLQQPDVCRIHSDRDFFRLLRKAYVEYRRGKQWKFVRQIQQLDFSQFELYHDSLVDIKASPSMPSLEARHEYDYEPPDTNPPIGPNMSMHLLQNPDHAPVLPILVRRVPVRRNSRLKPCPTKGFSAGWGINFIEGVNGWASFFCGFLGFVLCLTASIVWTGVKGDVQGGFGIGAFILAFSLFCSAKLHLLL